MLDPWPYVPYIRVVSCHCRSLPHHRQLVGSDISFQTFWPRFGSVFFHQSESTIFPNFVITFSHSQTTSIPTVQKPTYFHLVSVFMLFPPFFLNSLFQIKNKSRATHYQILIVVLPRGFRFYELNSTTDIRIVNVFIAISWFWSILFFS